MFAKYKWVLIILGSLALLMAIYMAVSYFSAQAKDEGRSEEKERQALILTQVKEENQKAFERMMDENRKENEKRDEKIATLAQGMLVRAQAYQGQVQTIQKATGADDIIKQLKDYLQVTATSPAPGMVTLPADQAQNLVLLDLENKKLREDLNDLKSQFEIETSKTKSLQGTLDEALARIREDARLISEWESVSKSWKITAKKSKWKRVEDYAYKAAAAAAIIWGLKK